MCDMQTQKKGSNCHPAETCGCHAPGAHQGFLSKKMRIQALEKQLDHMKTRTEDLEEYIRELKEG